MTSVCETESSILDLLEDDESWMNSLYEKAESSILDNKGLESGCEKYSTLKEAEARCQGKPGTRIFSKARLI